MVFNTYNVFCLLLFLARVSDTCSINCLVTYLLTHLVLTVHGSQFGTGGLTDERERRVMRLWDGRGNK